MYLYFLCIMFLFVGCNTRVVPLNFKLDEPKHVNVAISENELIDESPVDEVEKSGHNLPDTKQSNDVELLISEDKNSAGLGDSNSNGSHLSVELESKEKDEGEESNLASDESVTISSLPDDEVNSTSEFTSKNDSDSKDPLKSLQVNVTRNPEAIDNLTVKNEIFIGNNSSRNLQLSSSVEYAEHERKILNESLDHQNVWEEFNGINNTDNSLHLEPMSNDTEVEAFLKNTENMTDPQKETFVVFEAFNDINNNSQPQPMSNDTEGGIFLSNSKNITTEMKSNSLTRENLDLANDSVNTAGGIFSGFEFLINSEVARNAAKAMEVFNFTDPLTDHIMEENEFHSFLPTFNGETILDSENKADLNAEISIANSSEESKIKDHLNTFLPSEDKTSMVLNQTKPEEISMVLNQTEASINKKNSSMPFNLNESLKGGNGTEIFNLVEKRNENVTLSLKNPKETIELVSEETSSNPNSSVSNSSSVAVPECPPPGWCIFSFLSQDTCAVNEHCLGSRICCKIGCSKTCIEIESEATLLF